MAKYAREFKDVKHSTEFLWEGFSFECDKNGKLINPTDETFENYKRCINFDDRYIDEGIKKLED